MGSIPISVDVNITPGVLSAGGDSLQFNGLILTENTRVPIGTVQSFATPADVDAFFGDSTDEATAATEYFLSFDRKTVTPGALLFAQYPAAAVPAYLRGGNISSLTLSQLQGLTGTLTVVIDGYTHTAADVDLSAATSFSSGATIIATALFASEPTEATFTGAFGASFTGTAASPSTHITVASITGKINVGDTLTGTGIPANTTVLSQVSGSTGGNGEYLLSAANTTSSASCTAASTTLVVSAVASGTLAVGQTIAGSGVIGTPVITALGTGTGLTGTYLVSTQQEVASESMTAVATAGTVVYDSVSGAYIISSGITGAPSTMAYATGTIAPSLLLNAATGAVLSQGADAATPVSFMDGIVDVTQNWVPFMTLFDPDGTPGVNTLKMEFTAWTNGTDNQYAYACWDPDPAPQNTVPASNSMGQKLIANGASGTYLINAPTFDIAAFNLGIPAGIDFARLNGRTNFKFREQSGLSPNIQSASVRANLIANGYNFYGAYATRNMPFVYMAPGSVSGKFKWMDSYINQISLNNGLQLAFIELLTNVSSLPYNDDGYAQVRAAAQDPIDAALNFGSIRKGVALSDAQAAEVNAAAGLKISDVIQQLGFYLQILPAPALTRGRRATPPMTLWYQDGEDINSLDLASIEIQ